MLSLRRLHGCRSQGDVDVEKQEALLREMVKMAKDDRSASDEQARAFFDKAMEGVAEVARGGGGHDGKDTVECPACHRQVPASARFCQYCQHQMRA